MNISLKITTSLWIASKSLAFIGILLCFFPGQWGFSFRVTASRGIFLAMRDTLPVVFFCLAALVGVIAWALETHRLLQAPVPN
jgi:hypothetical protein